MEEKKKIGKGAIPVDLVLEVEDYRYKLTGDAIPVEGLAEPQVGKDAIPVSLTLVLENHKYEVKGAAKRVS